MVIGTVIMLKLPRELENLSRAQSSCNATLIAPAPAITKLSGSPQRISMSSLRLLGNCYRIRQERGRVD